MRLMPGVRIRISRRGVRTSIGPRLARFHFGGGRVGFSTGAGPVSYSTSFSTSSRAPRRSTSRVATGDIDELLEEANVAVDRATRLLEVFNSINALHRQTFSMNKTESTLDDLTLMSVLAKGLEGGRSGAAPVAVEGGTAYVAVRVPGEDMVPRETTDDVGRSGIIRFRPLTALEVDAFYTNLVEGFILCTATEVVSLAPGLEKIHVVAVRETPQSVQALMAAELSSKDLNPLRWQKLLADEVLPRIAKKLVVGYYGPHNFLGPIDLAVEPDIAALVAVIQRDVAFTG